MSDVNRCSCNTLHSPEREPHMTHAQRNQKILEAIAKETARAIASRKIARDTLIGEGIYTTEGKLRAEFGGQPKKAKVAA
jgi:hypothetical protein